MSEIKKVKHEDEKYCESCGEIIKKAAEICPKCGVRQNPPPTINPQNISDKNRLVAFLLCSFLGTFGVHRFYVGKITSGIMQLLFGWATLFIWNLVDWIMILAGTFTDKDGKRVYKWSD
jgi:hypothetical protein